MVRAKFKCEQVITFESGATVKLHPVHEGSEENEEFYKYTPGGELSLMTINLQAAKQFIPGKEYYIDITPAE